MATTFFAQLIAVNYLLLRERTGISELNIVVGFDGVDGYKSPAGTAASLIPSRVHIRSPVDFGCLLD